MERIARSLLMPFHDFIFVRSCFHCGAELREDEKRICGQCWSSLAVVGENDYTFRILKDRFAGSGAVDDCTALFYFEKGKMLQSLAHALKYQETTVFGIELGEKLSRKLTGVHIDAIVPIPLNKRKERERGYNQSDYIARGISSIVHAPVLSKTVRRVKYTVTQTRLNADQRKANIAEAFDVVDPDGIKGKNILVVDDIITTGSTIQEVCRVLKASGAQMVIAASAGLARLGEDA